MTATRTIHPHHLSTRIIAWTLHAICAVSLWATLAACHRTEKTHSILPDGCKLRAGDVVFRRGTGMTSRAVLTADVNGNYSHVGIVVDSAGQAMIVHAVPGEPDYAGDVDRVKMDTPSTFFSSAYASMGEICRPTNDTVAQGAARTALRLYRKGVLFDDEFNDKDTTKMYCTELIAYAFQHAGVDIVGKRRHKVDLAIIKAECILPSDIHASRHLRTIIMFHK
jgi:hypothetical protein